MDTHLPFGDYLKASRTARKLTQERLAELVGYSIVSIRKIEANQQRPSRFLAERLAEELDLSHDELKAFVRLARRPLHETTASSSPAFVHNNLPERLPQLFGRVREIQAICSLLRRPETALLTLTGYGGVGKTRLALQVATEMKDQFKAGVCFVPLAPISEQALVIPTIARALNLQPQSSETPDSLLTDYLKDQELLLVLDNLEQIPTIAPLLGELIDAAPRLKILATSRSALHSYHEQEFHVPCLALPDPSEFETLETLAQSPAVALFAAKAQAKNHDFQLTSSNTLAIAEICIQLDGLPLALELAAAWIKILSPHDILQRLSHRLQLLTNGPVDVPDRHRALRNTIDWSYQLLDADEQALFARLGVFAGGSTLSAIEAICVLDTDPPQNHSILHQLEALTDRNVLQSVSDPDGDVRFMILETLHEYAAELLLTRSELEAVRRKHAQYYLRLAQKIVPKLWEFEAERWLSGLLAEYGNLHATLYWLIEQGDGEDATRLFETLVHFWTMQRKTSEIGGQTEHILEMSRQLPVERHLSTLSLVGSVFRDMQNDYERALQCYDEQLRIAREQGDVLATAISLDESGLTLLELGQYDQARLLLQESKTVLEENGIRDHMACCALRSLGIVALYQGHLTEAKDLLDQSLRLSLELDIKLDYASTLNQLGRIELYRGNYSQAQALHEECLQLFSLLGNRRAYAHALCNLGPVYLYQGELDQARTVVKDSLIIWQYLEDFHGNIWNLERLAEIAAQCNQPRRAVQLWGAAEAFREKLRVPLPPVERQRYAQPVAALQAQFSQSDWLIAWKQGRKLSLRQALSLALTDE